MKAMRFRGLPLASLLLLLASLGAAEGATLRETGFTVGGHYIAVLLAQDMAANAEHTLAVPPANILLLTAPAAALAHTRTAWTMRPAAAHSAALEAATSFAI